MLYSIFHFLAFGRGGAKKTGRLNACPSFKLVAVFCGCTARFVSELVENSEDRFSHDASQLFVIVSFTLLSFFPHYENMPMQYTAIFQGCKNYNFLMTKCYIFLIFAQNIDCGYTLEPPQ